MRRRSLVDRRDRVVRSSARSLKRRAVFIAALVTIGGSLATGIALTARKTDAPSELSSDSTVKTAKEARRTATVTRRDLQFRFQMWGVLGRSGLRAVQGGDGVVTTLPKPGAEVSAGQALFGLDGHDGPILMIGDLPMWRTVGTGVAPGRDIRQIESNLVDLGFAADDLVVDDTFDDATKRAIERFQEARGLAVTGQIERHVVWFSPGPVRVATVTKDLGDSAAGTVLSVSSLRQVITVDLDPTQIAYASVGAQVDLDLVDGSSVRASITAVAARADFVTVNGERTDETIAVEITPEAPLQAVDNSSIIVKFTAVTAADALCVPVDAIVATADGRFAVEVIGPAHRTKLVQVELGRNADGWVEITGDVAEGSTVVTA